MFSLLQFVSYRLSLQAWQYHLLLTCSIRNFAQKGKKKKEQLPYVLVRALQSMA